MIKVALASITLAALILLSGFALTTYLEAQEQPEAQVTPKPVVKKSKYETGPPDATEMLELVNEERKKVGVKPLKLHAALTKSAQYKADDMVKYDYFAHISPNDKREGYTYVSDYMPECKYPSENISLTTNDLHISGEPHTDSATPIIGWVESKPHYKAMVDSGFDFVGFGHNKGYVVAHFCDMQAR